MTVPRLAFEAVTKSFGPVQVLKGVSFDVAPGEVHGLLGENGAGKSTLLKILSGVFRPTDGRVLIDGKPVDAHGPVAARRAGIAMIHQELQQVPRLTVAQNMFLGRPLTHLGMIVDHREQERLAAQALRAIDPSIDPSAPIGKLKVAQRQIVEIARALLEDAKLVAMDEPTSSLTPAEFDRLAEIIFDLSARGVSVVYVSHKMDEIFRICSRSSIMRDGQLVGSVDMKETDQKSVVSMMVGRELSQQTHTSFATDQVVLEATNLSSAAKVRDVSLTLHKGEVLGIAGLVGSGRTELLRLIAGADQRSAGDVSIDGKPVALKSPREAIASGIGLVPEERKREGIIPLRSVRNNIALASMSRFAPHGVVNSRALKAVSATTLKETGLRPFAPEREIRRFSGGNQQKAIISRWLAAETRIFLFDEPTRGIDVGAKAEIYALIEKLAQEGKSVIVVSSELPEVIRLSDRVLVMREGQLAAELSGDAITEEAIASHAIPQSPATAAGTPAAPLAN
ncbi:monosaccharide ABC transporter ATP-binding protein, CUT2 family [Devosia sp. YR412]|uniref:sugar ABC transporter ATP-binding protein n=1 Tax=Devosia sp. YR412 TaxID=1881030 RepID=UPI0008B296DD|nr:sugar ABC transporter ATP-binding protein [Devosia sp. YR412]SEP73754.1 monosaccharide ABC transporter ATP-binding protein, CUT2 family [Devosia sp. YR412]